MTKKHKRIQQRKRLAAVFASLSILVIGTVSLCESMSLDYYSVLNTLQKIIPASIVIGGLGWVMGMVLDKPKRGHSISYNSEFLKNVITQEMASSDSNEVDEVMPDA